MATNLSNGRIYAFRWRINRYRHQKQTKKPQQKDKEEGEKKQKASFKSTTHDPSLPNPNPNPKKEKEKRKEYLTSLSLSLSGQNNERGCDDGFVAMKKSDFPALDVFICTADLYKEPPIRLVSIALLVMAYDYPT